MLNYTINHYSNILSIEDITEIAKETKFMKRSKGVPPHLFLDAILNPSINIASDSLNKFSIEVMKKNIDISRQAVFQKFSEPCVKFLAEVLKRLISKTKNSKKISKIQGNSDSISSVLVADSSSITLNPVHSNEYAGLSSKLKSVMKILLAINPETFEIIAIETGDGRKSDHNFNDSLQNFEVNALILKDLGFTSILDQEQITFNGGKYISRVKLDTDLYIRGEDKYTKDGKLIQSSLYKKISVPEVYSSLKEDEVADDVYYFKNKNEFYERRVIISKVPVEKLKIREQSATTKLRDKDHQISEKTRSMLPFTIYTTTLTPEEVPAENIHGIYARRWDIELIFKKLKGTYDLDDVKSNVNINRILIHIYSKLILFTLDCIYTQEISALLPNVELSIFQIGKFLKSYLETVHRTREEVQISIESWIRKLKKDKKKQNKTLSAPDSLI